MFIFLVAAAYGWARFWKADPRKTRRPPVAAPVDVSDGVKVSLVNVVDGDTVKVRYQGRIESVRLLRINTPEREQRGYGEATRALKTVVDRGYLILQFENDREERDRHGRLLAYVTADGMNANIEMVRQGWSRFWTKYGPGKFARAFELAEAEARANRAGLWTPQGWNPR